MEHCTLCLQVMWTTSGDFGRMSHRCEHDPTTSTSYERSDGIFVSVALMMMMMMMMIMMMVMMQRFDGLLLVLTDSGDTWNCFTSNFSFCSYFVKYMLHNWWAGIDVMLYLSCMNNKYCSGWKVLTFAKGVSLNMPTRDAEFRNLVLWVTIKTFFFSFFFSFSFFKKTSWF